MYITTGDNVRIAYRFDGAEHLPILILSNSIGTSYHMWDGEVDALSQHFRVLRYDARGHGESGVPAGAYSLDRLGRDVLELMDALGIGRAHFLGLSLGGFIGQWLGIHAPDRIDRLVLSNTAAQLGPASVFDERIATVRAAQDMRETAEGFLANWFPKHMLDAGGPVVDKFRAMLLATDREGLAGLFAAVRDADLRRTIRLIEAPTLVIAGRDDTVTSAQHGADIAAAISGARLLTLPTVHLSNIERRQEYLDAVLHFLR
ncbi:3-oxoadipate enol-lactonase [Duganella sp. Root1480D1]|uniref:3-oxoadipate enol-lactonase n=1 Tax=Duganella sp. Root1480D1 TaxID=1736471 RepID=UPI000709F062|nr:3-oxoadipate enol-lactonase [Duganella sp. Root1480D1]KQZ44256.1 3-oxoadipate enol-lactonase [Duganella sp. Root1480D1]